MEQTMISRQEALSVVQEKTIPSIIGSRVPESSDNNTKLPQGYDSIYSSSLTDEKGPVLPLAENVYGMNKPKEIHFGGMRAGWYGSFKVCRDWLQSLSGALTIYGLLWLLYFYYRLPFHTDEFCSQSGHIRDLAAAKGVPGYVLVYAPMVYLDERELYGPSDMQAQISHTQPKVDYEVPKGLPTPLTEHNLDALNKFGHRGLNVHLTSVADITSSPSYLFGVSPNAKGCTVNATSAAIIINDKGAGLLDAYYMYFYAYNQGNTVFGHELGDHVGDWEHNMIRFQNGIPQAVWYSQHASGEAFTYQVTEKIGLRPISYSARGSHANYAVEGIHDHAIPDLNLPFGFVRDYTSRGKLWDPTLSAHWYTFNATEKSFSVEGKNNNSPLGVMRYQGRWGDQRYPDDDPRQDTFFGFKKYGSGPTGPWDKQLDRKAMCTTSQFPCIIRHRLGP